jgi:DNA topoisomerase VI subunit B
MTNTLNRTSFVTNRALEYFTEKNLMQQIGCGSHLWPIALLKELIDNALDAAEMAGASPCITVTVAPDAVCVEDNGPGLPDKVIEKSLDYEVRASDKAHYVSPTRGQLGNALKCVWAAPYVIDSEKGCIEIHTGHKRHLIEVALDRIAQKPEIRHTVEALPIVKNGTFLKMHYPEIKLSGRLQGLEFTRKVRARANRRICRVQPAQYFRLVRCRRRDTLFSDETGLAKVARGRSDITTLVHGGAVAHSDCRLCLA